MKNEIWEPLEAEYKPKVIALAEQVRRDMALSGWACSSVCDWTDEDLAVSFVYYPLGSSRVKPEHAIDLTFRLMDAGAWDAEPEMETDGFGAGTSFSVDICEYGGLIMGGIHLYNYSPQVWVDAQDTEAVAARWREFENAASDSQEFMAVISQWRADHAEV